MKIYGLVGKSGTGKSFQAMTLCRQRNIEAVIDDGLFIYGTGIQAGISAKRQSTKIGAVKTALFTKEAHRLEVLEKIKEIQPSSILILGTSKGMILRIINRLEIPPLSETISIESITTQSQRETARKQRQELGKHVIPAPTFQVKRQFSGYFLDPMRIFRGKNMERSSFNEKTVVRPTYSYLGDYSISDKVISEIVGYISTLIPEIFSITRTTIDNTPDGLSIRVLIYAKHGTNMLQTARLFQKKIALEVEKMTAFNITSVDIEIRGLR
ncbi:MAG: hypothetical protein VB095_13255 [Anaerovorax sp.]|nr:hypothetical protein [Anaerovorax sp.]